MKKIPTLFTRIFEDHQIVGIRGDITPGCEDAFYNGDATIKIDGACCAVIDGVFYKRYDAKRVIVNVSKNFFIEINFC